MCYTHSSLSSTSRWYFVWVACQRTDVACFYFMVQGEKFDLDVTHKGERWGLPIHLLDGIFAATSGKSTQFEKRGLAAEALEELRQIIDEG